MEDLVSEKRVSFGKNLEILQIKAGENSKTTTNGSGLHLDDCVIYRDIWVRQDHGITFWISPKLNLYPNIFREKQAQLSLNSFKLLIFIKSQPDPSCMNRSSPCCQSWRFYDPLPIILHFKKDLQSNTPIRLIDFFYSHRHQQCQSSRVSFLHTGIIQFRGSAHSIFLFTVNVFTFILSCWFKF